MDSAELSRIAKVLSVGTRIDILRLLKGRALCVGALAARLDVTQGAVSQHLRVMRDAGLVVDERKGYYVHYRLNESTLAAWRKALDKLLNPRKRGRTDKEGARACAAAMRTRRAAATRKS
jgi:DNA-binding transcriptional ArsR family regulator